MAKPTTPIPAHSKLHYFVHATGWIPCVVVAFSDSVLLKQFAAQHLSIQATWFVVVACLPALFTGVMYWVDFAWPWGLTWIGAFTYWFASFDAELATTRRTLICAAFALHGARMGAGALFMIASGTWTIDKDLPRYQFQKIRVEHNGGSWNMVVMQKEILMQCFANGGLLFLPCFLCATDKTPGLSWLEILGYCVWATGWAIESVADGHKLKWGTLPKKTRGAFCNVGLWKFSRHPNYFGEWVAWNGLVLAAIHPLVRFECEKVWVRAGLAFMLVLISTNLYYCLSEWTGAVPAEYFSVQKRAGYDAYIRTTSMIIPWFVAEEERGSSSTPKKKEAAKAETATPAYIRRVKRAAEAEKKPKRSGSGSRGRSSSRSSSRVSSRGSSRDSGSRGGSRPGTGGGRRGVGGGLYDGLGMTRPQTASERIEAGFLQKLREEAGLAVDNPNDEMDFEDEEDIENAEILNLIERNETGLAKIRQDLISANNELSEYERKENQSEPNGAVSKAKEGSKGFKGGGVTGGDKLSVRQLLEMRSQRN